LFGQHHIDRRKGSLVSRVRNQCEITRTCQSIDELKLIRDETIQLLKLGAFELRKWALNCPELLETDNRDHLPVIIRDNAATHVFWACNGISVRIRFNFSANLTEPHVVSKRVILSEITKLFDPLGLLGSVIRCNRKAYLARFVAIGHPMG